MTDLPDELLEALKNNEQAQMKHNWMYSFMPVRGSSKEAFMYQDEIYLVGYCKICDQTVSSRVPYDFVGTVVNDACIPKWGCVPKQEL